MLPDSRFRGQSREFWANVRTIGQQVGYSVRGENRIRVPTLEEMCDAFGTLQLKVGHGSLNMGVPLNWDRVCLTTFSIVRMYWAASSNLG